MVQIIWEPIANANLRFMNRPPYLDIRDCKTLHRDWSAIGMRLMQSSIVYMGENNSLYNCCSYLVVCCSLACWVFMPIEESKVILNIEKSACQSFCRHSFHVIEKSAIDPRLIRDCAAIEEPPNVVTGPLPAHVSCPFLQGLARQGSAGCTSLWLAYISMYMKIVLLFSVHMTLERTKSLRDCHLWGRDWFAIDRRLYPSQEPLFWSTPIWF